MSEPTFNSQFNTRQFNGGAASTVIVEPTGNADDIQKYFFEVHDKDEYLVAILDKVQNGKMTRVVNGVGSLTFDYPGMDDNCDYLTFPYQVWIYNQRHTLIEKFVILPTKRIMSASGYSHNVQCASLIHEMIRTHVESFTYPTERRVDHWLVDLFTRQPNNGKRFTLRYIDNSIARQTHSFDFTNMNMLQIIDGIFSAVNTGYYWVNSDREFYWMNKMNTFTGQQIRLGKNMSGVTITEDPSSIINQIYIYGQDQTTNERISLGVQNHYTSQSLYGILPASKELKQCGDLTMLATYAQNYLNIYAYPRMTYDIDCVNLSNAYPDIHWFDELNIGTRVQILNEDLDIAIWDMVVQLEDDLSNPTRQRVVLGNAPPTLDEPIETILERIGNEERAGSTPLTEDEPSDIDSDAEASAGDSTAAARADHTHALGDVYEEIETPSDIEATGVTSSRGTSSKIARADHGHSLSSDVYSSDVPSTVAPTDNTGSDGDSTTLSKSDHTHGLDDSVTYWDGTSGNLATQFSNMLDTSSAAVDALREDLNEAIEAGTETPEVIVDTTGDAGDSTSFSASNHSHQGMPWVQAADLANLPSSNDGVIAYTTTDKKGYMRMDGEWICFTHWDVFE